MAFLIPEAVEAVAGAGAEAGAAEAGAAESTEAAAAQDEDAPHGEHDLGHGNSMHMSPAQFQAMLHSPAVAAAVMDRAEKCAETANSLAITEGAEYAVSLQNKPDHTRARAAVYAANFKAVVDELNHSTLLKAAAQTGSDPKMKAPESKEKHEKPEHEKPEREEEHGAKGEAEGLGEKALGEL